LFSHIKRDRYALVVACLFICSILFVFSSVNATEIKIKKNFKTIQLGKVIEYLEDPSEILDLHDVQKRKISRLFQKSTDSRPSFGFTDSAYWVRFRVHNEDSVQRLWFLEMEYPKLDSLKVYVLNERKQLIEKRVGGDAYPFVKREIDYRNLIFKYAIPPQRTYTYVIRIKTSGTMNLSMVMWHPKIFQSMITRDNLAQGIYYGAILVMLLYNLFLFFSIKDKSYFFYVTYYLFFSFFQLANSGMGAQFIWTSNTWWSNIGLHLFLCLSIIFAIQFARYYLNIIKLVPKIDVILKVVILISSILAVLSLTSFYTYILVAAIFLAFLTAIIITIALIIILRSGFKPARFYAIAWSLFWISTVIIGLKSFSIIPDVFFTRWGQQIASLFEVVLMSFGLADRINFMKKDLEILNENLEQAVEERTLELYDTLKFLRKRDRDMQVELELAGDIQSGILPPMPYSSEGIRVVSYYSAMGIVGGDFYDIFKMKGGYHGILIADASGHGMPAAFITALAKISFSEAIQQSLFPRDVFIHVNNDLIETIKTDDFVTAFFVVISPQFEVFYSNASHQMAYVYRKKENRIDTWDTNGLFMGAMDVANEMYEDGRDHLDYGDRILLFTDGIIEARNIENEIFGNDRLIQLFIDTSELSIDESKDEIIRLWKEFSDGTEQSDDVTLVIIEIDPKYEKLVELREKGFYNLAHGDMNKAIEFLYGALEIDPHDEQSHLYIGECYLNIDDYFKSIDHLKLYLNNNEIDANVWYDLARAYFLTGQHELSVHASRKASYYRNGFVDAMLLRVRSLLKLSNRPDARNLLIKVLEIDPRNEEANEILEIL